MHEKDRLEEADKVIDSALVWVYRGANCSRSHQLSRLTRQPAENLREHVSLTHPSDL
jgi:hypothetical protein